MEKWINSSSDNLKIFVNLIFRYDSAYTRERNYIRLLELRYNDYEEFIREIYNLESFLDEEGNETLNEYIYV